MCCNVRCVVLQVDCQRLDRAWTYPCGSLRMNEEQGKQEEEERHGAVGLATL